jgi:hypothetical protein
MQPDLPDAQHAAETMIVRKMQGLHGWRSALLWGGAAVLVLRLVLGLVMGTAWLVLRPYLLPNLNRAELGGLPLYQGLAGEALLGVWPRWDAIHHLNLARLGYSDQSEAESVYYPLYAGLTRLATALTGGDYVIGGLLIATLGAWGAFACLYGLAERFYGIQTARWALVSLAVYPTALFLVAPFTESLFLALTLGAFCAAYARRWLLAGLLGFLASLSRGPGMFTAAALLWIAWDEWQGAQPRHIRDVILPLIGASLPALGGLTFLGWRAWMGYPTIGEITARYSGLILVNPGRGLISAISQWIRIHDLYTTLDVFSALFFLAIFGLMCVQPRWRRIEWIIYVGANLFVFLSKESFVASSLQSTARYVLALFPAFIVLGDWLGRQSRPIRFALIAASSSTALVLSILYSLWIFIG